MSRKHPNTESFLAAYKRSESALDRSEMLAWHNFTRAKARYAQRFSTEWDPLQRWKADRAAHIKASVEEDTDAAKPRTGKEVLVSSREELGRLLLAMRAECRKYQKRATSQPQE